MKSLFDKLVLADVNSGVFDGEWRGGGATIEKISPIDGRRLASVRTASDDDYNKAIARAHDAFLKWRVTPGPVRGETVRRLGNALRDLKHEPMTWPLRLDRQAVKHPRLPEGEIANVDHLLNFALAFRNNFSGLQRH